MAATLPHLRVQRQVSDPKADSLRKLGGFSVLQCIHTPVAVVGRRPHGEHGLVEVPLVPLHDQLVSAADHVDVVGGVELGHHVASKQVASASGTHPPPSGI